MGEILLNGATGRAGRAIACRLDAQGAELVLAGRDAAKLQSLAGSLDREPRTVVAPTVADLARTVREERPAIVVNAAGPFTDSGPALARACLGGTHYIDLANELDAVSSILELHDEATAAGDCLVTGSGFGVLATECLVVALCAGRPPAARVRVDAIPAVETLGPTVLASAIDVLGSGGRRVEEGRLVGARIGAGALTLRLPDGSKATTLPIATGELLAAWRAGRARSVLAASSEVPTAWPVRLLLPLAAATLSRRAVRERVKRLAARSRIGPPARSGTNSWGHARVEWEDGELREGWLRTGEGYDFTAAVACETVRRLAAGEGEPGAYTPGALFGAGLAEAAGAELFLNQTGAPGD